MLLLIIIIIVITNKKNSITALTYNFSQKMVVKKDLKNVEYLTHMAIFFVSQKIKNVQQMK